MRSKVSWWMSVVLLSVVYGFVGVTATFAYAFESMFGRRDDFSILQASSGWIMAAAVSLLALTIIVGGVCAALQRPHAVDACVDLTRLHGAAAWGSLIPYACGSDHPWIFTPMAFGIGALLLAVDRRDAENAQPWQTWALAALAAFVALPPLFISRL